MLNVRQPMPIGQDVGRNAFWVGTRNVIHDKEYSTVPLGCGSLILKYDVQATMGFTIS